MVPRVRIELAGFDDPDALELRAEHEAYSISLYGDDAEPGPPATSADIAVFVIARDDEGTAVGCGGLRPLVAPEGACEIKRMFVREHARGRGIGGAVLDVLEDHARRLGFASIRLETGDRQDEAMAMYANAGYRRIDCWHGGPKSVCFEKTL